MPRLTASLKTGSVRENLRGDGVLLYLPRVKLSEACTTFEGCARPGPSPEDFLKEVSKVFQTPHMDPWGVM